MGARLRTWRYRVLLLDLDGTIVDYARTESSALACLYAEYFAGAMTYQEFATAFHACNSRLWARYRLGDIDLARLATQRFAGLAARCGIQIPPGEIAARFEAGLGESVVLYRDARPALLRLGRCFRLVLVTDGIAAVQHVKLARTRLAGVFEDVIISSEVGYRKPDPALLRVALARAGVAAADALVVGDSLVSDGAGATAAGIDFCWVNRAEPGAAAPITASLIVPHLMALTRVLIRSRATVASGR